MSTEDEMVNQPKSEDSELEQTKISNLEKLLAKFDNMQDELANESKKLKKRNESTKEMMELAKRLYDDALNVHKSGLTFESKLEELKQLSEQVKTELVNSVDNERKLKILEEAMSDHIQTTNESVFGKYMNVDDLDGGEKEKKIFEDHHKEVCDVFDFVKQYLSTL